MNRPRAMPGFASIAAVIAVAAVLNAFAYTLVVADPLVQSDLWRMLDGFLGRYIDHGFRWADLFTDPHASNTNFPHYKLMLMLNVRWFALDLRLEGVVAVLAAAANVWVLARTAADRPLRAWSASEAWLLAAMALIILSLNASNNYAWPLALAWHVPMLMAVVFFGVAAGASWRTLLAASALLGVLLDEFAYPIAIAALLARILAAPGGRRLAVPAIATAGGLAISRLFYALWQWASPAPMGGADATVAMTRSVHGLFSGETWKAVALPLQDSLIHGDHLAGVFGNGAGAARWTIVLAMAVAHVWFWARVVSIRRKGGGGRIAFLAVAIMLLAYATVAAVLLQRVPEFGFDYLDQPRYVLFYQFMLAALAIMGYRETAHTEGSGLRARHAVMPLVVCGLLVIQLWLSGLAWERAKYVSLYYQAMAVDIGKVAAAPRAEHVCAPPVRVCTFAPEQRQRIVDRLVRHRLNLFSTSFQAMHRLSPSGAAEQPSGQGP